MIVIDLYLLLYFTLPPAHSTEEVFSYLQAAFKPLETLQTSFYEFFEQKKYDLQFNYQVCMLEHLLNDQFDPEDRGIYITDADFIEQTYLFQQSEGNEPLYVFNDTEDESPVYLFNQSEVSQFDFIVNVPEAVEFNIDLMKFYLNKYKHAAKRYKIEII
mgnify:CR=1 FL=1